MNPRGGGIPIWKGGDTGQRIWIKPLKETNLGVDQALSES